MENTSEKSLYDVIFITRKNGSVERAGVVLERVDKIAAIQAAKKYCHKGPLNEGVAITHHGTMDVPAGAEWWFQC